MMPKSVRERKTKNLDETDLQALARARAQSEGRKGRETREDTAGAGAPAKDGGEGAEVRPRRTAAEAEIVVTEDEGTPRVAVAEVAVAVVAVTTNEDTLGQSRAVLDAGLVVHEVRNNHVIEKTGKARAVATQVAVISAPHLLVRHVPWMLGAGENFKNSALTRHCLINLGKVFTR